VHYSMAGWFLHAFLLSMIVMRELVAR